MTRTTGRLAGLTATLLISTLALAACGDDSDSGSKSGDPGSSTASPSESESATESESASASASQTTLDGDMVGAGYAYDLPDGWKDTTKQAKKLQATIDTAAAEAEPDDGNLAIITFSFSREVPEAKRNEVISTVIDSWQWKTA